MGKTKRTDKANRTNRNSAAGGAHGTGRPRRTDGAGRTNTTRGARGAGATPAKHAAGGTRGMHGTGEVELLKSAAAARPGRATLAVDLSRRSPHPVNPLLYGKFCEHLGYNIYRGMEAQILYNPTFGKIKVDENSVRRLAERFAWPDADRVVASYQDGGALGWFRLGAKEDVLLSPDAAPVGGPHGAQAQRVEIQQRAAGAGPSGVHAPGSGTESVGAPVTARGAAQAERPEIRNLKSEIINCGIGQWTSLPLHRTRGYEFRVVARAVEPCRITLALAPADSQEPLASAALDLAPEWQTFTGRLDIPADAPLDENGIFLLSVTADAPANIVLGRVILYPDDHVHHADRDVVRLLREARLPILRWPGGNFVSDYDWRDGVGPVDLRPTSPNRIWHGTFESNLFGTDEFMTLCRDIGCEPMICVNVGNGTPELAASWIEYCNGSAQTPMGRLRAKNGHPEPYGVHYWEIGNEIFGRHQTGWTTPAGNVDRFLRFAKAMRAADPSIRLLACGGLHLGVDAEWNRRLIADTGGAADLQTHHILEGGSVDERVDGADLYHAFMGYPILVARDYRLMRQRMLDGGIREPRLAITELQQFAFLPHKALDSCPIGNEIPTPASIAEALYLTLIIHECIRLGDFVEMITHSATVSHGGGLRKARERVWANPVHYAHVMGIELAGQFPVAVTLGCGTFSTEHEFGHIPLVKDVPDLDAMAVLSGDERTLTLMLVHRSAQAGPIALEVDLGGFKARPDAEVLTLAGEAYSDQNTIEAPEKIVPRAAKAKVRGSALALTLPPYSLTRVQLTRAKG